MANYVFAGLFSLVGIVFMRTSLNAKRRIQKSLRWPSIVGRLGNIEIGERMRRRTQRHFVIKLDYEYEVAGKVYAGDEDRIRFSQGNYLQSMAAAQRRVDEVKSKSPFLVYYDPSDPAESVLFREEPSASMKIMLAGIVSLALGLVMLLAAQR